MTNPNERRRLPAETDNCVRASRPEFCSFEPRNTVRCTDDPVFRSQTARDAACLLDVDTEVASSATNSAPIIIGSDRIEHDLTVHYCDRIEYIVAIDGDSPLSDALVVTAQQAGFKVRTVTAAGIAGDRLENARELLRYARWHVSLSSRVRLLTFLEHEGSASLADCLPVLPGRDAIAAIAALCLHRFVEIDLESGRIGPQTRVAPFRG